jgi:hypothetical protein
LSPLELESVVRHVYGLCRHISADSCPLNSFDFPCRSPA